MLGWRDVPLATLLAQAIAIDVPVIVEIDANAFAIAETYRGVSERSVGSRRYARWPAHGRVEPPGAAR